MIGTGKTTTVATMITGALMTIDRGDDYRRGNNYRRNDNYRGNDDYDQDDDYCRNDYRVG